MIRKGLGSKGHTELLRTFGFILQRSYGYVLRTYLSYSCNFDALRKRIRSLATGSAVFRAALYCVGPSHAMSAGRAGAGVIQLAPSLV